MRYFQLGNTDLKVSEVGFGGIPIIRADANQAEQTLRAAFEGGINFYDTANAYKDSEGKIGMAFAGMRDKILLATKTGRRDGIGALEHLENSLKMLRTDYIDLYQLHQISQEEDWEAASAPGGALEAVKKAQADGKIRYIGITSHSLSMAIKLIQTGYFATIQFPFNFIEEEARKNLFPLAEKLGLGIIAMKPFAGGMIDNAALAFKYLRNFPGVIPIPGLNSAAEVNEVLNIYKQTNVLNEADSALMEDYRNKLGKKFCRRCEYCMPCPNNVLITPIMGYKVIAGRMSKQVAVNFSKWAMDTAPACVNCNTCIPRCPYELPIPDMIGEHYAIYQKHLEEVKEEGKK